MILDPNLDLVWYYPFLNCYIQMILLWTHTYEHINNNIEAFKKIKPIFIVYDFVMFHDMPHQMIEKTKTRRNAFIVSFCTYIIIFNKYKKPGLLPTLDLIMSLIPFRGVSSLMDMPSYDVPFPFFLLKIFLYQEKK